MDDDPLPARAVPYHDVLARIEQGKTKQFVAIVLCLFLGLALAFTPVWLLNNPKRDSGY